MNASVQVENNQTQSEQVVENSQNPNLIPLDVVEVKMQGLDVASTQAANDVKNTEALTALGQDTSGGLVTENTADATQQEAVAHNLSLGDAADMRAEAWSRARSVDVAGSPSTEQDSPLSQENPAEESQIAQAQELSEKIEQALSQYGIEVENSPQSLQNQASIMEDLQIADMTPFNLGLTEERDNVIEVDFNKNNPGQLVGAIAGAIVENSIEQAKEDAKQKAEEAPEIKQEIYKQEAEIAGLKAEVAERVARIRGSLDEFNGQEIALEIAGLNSELSNERADLQALRSEAA